MKTILSILYCCIFAFVSSAFASPRVGVKPSGICTRDINPWGHASQCSCNDGDLYDGRSGLCLTGVTPEKIMIQGAVSAGMMAIGGESTGFTIETSEGKLYELILKTVDQKKLSKQSEMWFEINGELITVQGVEMKERRVIIVEQLAVLE